MTFYLSHVELDGEPQPGKGYCTLYVYGEEPLPQLFDGARVFFTGRVYIPGEAGAPRFRLRMWLLQSRVSYGISSVRDLQIQTAQDAPWTTRFRIRMGMRAP